MQLAQDAIGALGLDQLLCIPAGRPPHRQQPQASALNRLEMAKLAFANEAKCFIDETEVLQESPSWTICTLERLHAVSPRRSHVLIVGADAFLGLPSWHRWQELLCFAHIAVANRPGFGLNPAEFPPLLATMWHKTYTDNLDCLHQQSAGCLVSFNIAPNSVSATQVRQRCREGSTLKGFVTEAVENYIREHHLYS